jgi:DNA-binding LacI/PurR family transcriptional regulator
VFFDRICEDILTPKVKVNNFDITAEATEYLIKRGYLKIAHLTGTTNITVFRDRQNGYESMISKYEIEYQNSVQISDDFNVEVGKDIFIELWGQPIKPDAIISSSIHLTIGILLEVRTLGVQIPKDLGIITFGSIVSSEVIEPQITYIDQQESEIAQLSFELLIKMIKHEIQLGESVEKIVQSKIIFKSSC